MSTEFPEMNNTPTKERRLTRAQQSELEMARRRAQKALEGKRANAEMVRRAKRRAPATEASSGDGDSATDRLEEGGREPAEGGPVKDEKEAKRLKRWGLLPSTRNWW
jgi:hypothetical protein